MDGNGRWAKERGLPRHLGHKEACNRIVEVFDYCKEFDIPVMSFYAFSTENWSRPKAEIRHLFTYLEVFFKKEINKLIKDGTRVMISGDVSRLPEKTQKTIAKTIELTKDCKNFVFNICLNYGGKEELTRAARNIAQEVKDGKLDIKDITEQVMEDHLYTAGLEHLAKLEFLISFHGNFAMQKWCSLQLNGQISNMNHSLIASKNTISATAALEV